MVFQDPLISLNPLIPIGDQLAETMLEHNDALVSIRDLTRVFDVSKPWLNRVIERPPRRRLTAVSEVSFDTPECRVYALVGESGSGESTIGRMVVGLLYPTGGAVDPPRGEIPDPISPSPGCTFHPRCLLAQGICAETRPERRDLRGARVACHFAE